ncbi:ABC transporter substrate-binding protein [Roseomonas elaeocarpi]|uniref:ABC transporter substrate-binding protein n=1 Tax=Roseomonas elaeocarpi TaxID=907779 RepID=A0ABV6JW53_9PROT
MTPRLRWIAPALVAALLAAPLPAWALKRGGTFSFGRAMDSIFLDPVHTTQNADIWISLNLYDTLLQPTPDGKGLEPGLAVEHTLSEDGKTLRFRLRPDTKFSDGSPITVGDVKWSLDRARNKDTGGDFAFLLESVASIDTEGQDVVILHLSKPDPAILQELATFNSGIMPEKLLMAAPGADLLEKSKNFAEHPIGSGPFVLSRWTRGSEMVLTRNPYYWKKGADGQALPYLDAVRLVIVPDDSTRILKLRAGEIDAAEFVPYSRVAELRNDPKLNMTLFPAAQVNYFSLNNRPKLPDGTANPLSDQRVRQALNYATNKQALNQLVSYNTGLPQRSFMPMTTPLASGPEQPYPYDLAKARALLAAAGFSNGFEITCLALAGNVDDNAKLVSLQQMWAPLGVKLKIEQLENATRLARTNNSDFQMRTALWTNDLNDPKQVTSLFTYYPLRQNQRTGWRDEGVEALFLQSQEELDVAKRAELYREIQARYLEAAPIVFGLEVPYPVAMAKKVHDFVQIPLGNNIFVGTYLE